MVLKMVVTGEGDYMVSVTFTDINAVHLQSAINVMKPTCENFTDNP